MGSVHAVTAQRLNDDGDGVGRIDGVTVFVPDLLPGEEARVSITTRERRFLRARVVERLTDAETRLTPTCAV
ncbi:MAG TPA: TRAM domain-containing protein, partial [Mycobacterium sp.]|nr:TRAM domain-containing protein [Mycobacterium sp.]